MIDLNDVWTPPPRIDLGAVKAQLAATAPDWLPDGSGGERVVACAETLLAIRLAQVFGVPVERRSQIAAGCGTCSYHVTNGGVAVEEEG